MGLFVGIDFIQDQHRNDYYLETNGAPGMEVYLKSKNQGQGTAVDGYRMVMEKIISELISKNET
ncbi:hypothetical protein A2272_04225 [Candidatus Peregrinibacteria bacterium RIFOXYA12_FULL_33_12]|nr:MAG: hypothetical protein A2263_01700 [Candidatus Peregrinibacteria bacterium RIFOXYA2_FULL_33_21]OGJ46251.1 MAG: hypothetical protein A2272_04225 [Candidatus Peregrinibacteria bacterium RIFOXYA12_FULL_33_12]OGJ51239.1 MAG: hypothetical protein A2307_01310 [Candidatus Peregrinibacteria bacterium RIFOXYB2_FULL_33_20]